jgi:hypothetical protein
MPISAPLTRNVLAGTQELQYPPFDRQERSGKILSCRVFLVFLKMHRNWLLKFDILLDTSASSSPDHIGSESCPKALEAVLIPNLGCADRSMGT